MFDSGAFGYVDVLNKAADNSWLRNEVLTNNIANGYILISFANKHISGKNSEKNENNIPVFSPKSLRI